MLASPQELQEILESWELEPTCEPLRSSWHNIFRVRREGRCLYLRITPSLRNPDEVLAELEWMQQLERDGLPVVKVHRHSSGDLMQRRQLASGLVSVCCFEEAPGRLTQKHLDFRAPVIKNWATLLFQLHEQARAYLPAHPTARRPLWHQDSVLQVAVGEARLSEEPEAPVFLRLIDRFRGAEAGSELTLTHADLHFGNLTINESNDALYAFDFDDACYHFPEHDVAVALVSIRKAAWEHPGLFDARPLETLFIETYAGTVSDLDLWCAYRIGLSFFWALGSVRADAFDDERTAWLQKSTPWWKAEFRTLTAL
jgi:Ser/Thr protein kinase RdoA (MazF antagonist)